MDLQRQLDLLYERFQGTFDNHMQCQLEKELQKRDGTDPVHDWVWKRVFPVDVPNLGPRVLLERQGFRATGQIYRQRLYKFRINAGEGCVENEIYKLKDESLFERAESDPLVVAQLDPQVDIECMEGCSVYWKYLQEENRFHGTTMEGKCRFASKFFPGKTIIASSDIYIGPEELWTHDRGVDTDGNKMYGFKSDEHHKFVRCTMYKGNVTLEGQSQEISLHNQGGEAKVGETNYSVTLAQAIDVDTKIETLRLSLLNRSDVMGMTMTDPNVCLIGGKFGEIQISLVKQD